MLGIKKRSATERHREQLRKLEKEKKEAQEVGAKVNDCLLFTNPKFSGLVCMYEAIFGEKNVKKYFGRGQNDGSVSKQQTVTGQPHYNTIFGVYRNKQCY